MGFFWVEVIVQFFNLLFISVLPLVSHLSREAVILVTDITPPQNQDLDFHRNIHVVVRMSKTIRFIKHFFLHGTLGNEVTTEVTLYCRGWIYVIIWKPFCAAWRYVFHLLRKRCRSVWEFDNTFLKMDTSLFSGHLGAFDALSHLMLSLQ